PASAPSCDPDVGLRLLARTGERDARGIGSARTTPDDYGAAGGAGTLRVLYHRICVRTTGTRTAAARGVGRGAGGVISMLEIVVELTPRCSSYMMHVSAGKNCGVGLR